MDFAAAMAQIKEASPRHRLDIGDPDVPPPQELLNALAKARDLHYGPPEGLPEFREAVADVFGVDPGEVVATAGGRHGLAALMWHFRKKKLLTPRPFYPGYFEIAEVFGLRLELVPTDHVWTPHFTERGVYVVNYPNNPTGVVPPRDKLRELVDVAEFVISDEIYRDIVFGEFTSPMELSASVAVVYSFSKVFSAPGLRVGAVIGPREVVREVAKFNKATVNVPPTTAQRAVAEAVHALPKMRAEISQIYSERVRLAERVLRLKFVKPQGAFYIFPHVEDGDMCFEKALSKGVALLPGSLYGSRGNVRMALVEDSDRLVEAFQLVNQACT
ncbi:MAG: pyridoxal phosphate-dependent aminotransferase [Pyrobaculum sp.]